MKNKIMNIIYYYTYFTLSIVFIAGMLGGLLDGDNIPAAIELGAVGIVINPIFYKLLRFFYLCHTITPTIIVIILKFSILWSFVEFSWKFSKTFKSASFHCILLNSKIQ